MQLVIFDPIAPRPYSLEELQRKPLGGAEASVVRIAERLDAIVLQHNRAKDEGRYRGVDASVDPTHLVILREPERAIQIFGRYPTARKYLWMHDLCGPESELGKELAANAIKLSKLGVTIICVSDFQANEARGNFFSVPETQRPIVKRIYLPVDVSDQNGTASGFDPNKLVFFSSPHKGLGYAMEIFSYLHRTNDDLRLYVANPGYRLKELPIRSGVVNLGPVPHHVILEHVRGALCTFCPNYVYPETFGLALAESNALGTPVIAHPIGAASEILLGHQQFIAIPKTRFVADQIYRRFPRVQNYGERLLAAAGSFAEYADKIYAWQSGKRPRVCGRAEFSYESVIGSWQQVLEA